MRSLVIALVLAVALAAGGDAAAQQSRRQRGGGDAPRDDKREQQRPSVPAFEPYAALERELPSLKVDLKLTVAQLDAWNVFERDVRHAAELDRARLRQQMALRDATHEPPPAIKLAGDWADLDKRKAEATADLVRHLGSLQELLDESQRRMLDRRVLLSQAEPLGTN